MLAAFALVALSVPAIAADKDAQKSESPRQEVQADKQAASGSIVFGDEKSASTTRAATRTTTRTARAPRSLGAIPLLTSAPRAPVWCPAARDPAYAGFLPPKSDAHPPWVGCFWVPSRQGRLRRISQMLIADRQQPGSPKQHPLRRFQKCQRYRPALFLRHRSAVLHAAESPQSASSRWWCATQSRLLL